MWRVKYREDGGGERKEGGGTGILGRKPIWKNATFVACVEGIIWYKQQSAPQAV